MVIMRSTKRRPRSLWLPKEHLRHRTPGRKSRSAWLLVGYSLVGHEGPQSLLVREDVGARPQHRRELGGDGALEGGLDLLAQGSHPRDELVTAQGAVAKPVPVVEHERRAGQQLASECAGGPVALRERHELAQQVGPADLA
jgi:hypothetical protein